MILMIKDIRAALINPFITSAVNAFTTMCFIRCERRSLKLKERSDQTPGDISGTVGIVGDINGIVAVTLSKEIACCVVSNMIGETVSTVNSVVEDAIGELTNIIAGNAKNILRSEGHNVSISLPSVLVGSYHVISTPANIPSVIVGFNTEISPFWLEICLKAD